jgi:hypothetical protein
MLAVVLCLVLLQTWALGQTLSTAPQFDRAVQGQTGAQWYWQTPAMETARHFAPPSGGVS